MVDVAQDAGAGTPAKNLRPPFPKGKSGNPRGRPQGAYSLSDLLRRALKKRTPDGKTRAWHLLQKMLAAFEADPTNAAIAKLIFDRMDGPLDSHVTVTATSFHEFLLRVEGATASEEEDARAHQA